MRNTSHNQRLIHKCFLIILFIIPACTSPPQGISQTEKPSPTITMILSTQSIYPTNTPEKQTTPLPIPTFSETPLAKTVDQQGFQPVTELPPSAIMDIYAAPNGELWLASGAGIYRFLDPSWELMLEIPADDILGLDTQGRLWVVIESGSRIAVYKDNGWEFYGPSQGWNVIESFQYLYPGFGDGLASGPDNDVWLATGFDELRHFDSRTSSWQSLTAAEIGFPVMEDDFYQGHYLTDVLTASDGSIYASSCTGEGEGFGGFGIRRYANNAWYWVYRSDHDCIMDMEIDAQGRTWAGAFDKLLLINGDHTVVQIPLPSYERLQVVLELELDPAGDPWVLVQKYGGGSIDGGQLLYQFHNNDWILHYEPDFLRSLDLAFTSEQTVWFCATGGLFKRNRTGLTFIPSPVVSLPCQIEVDILNRVWVAVQEYGGTGLWLLQSPD